MMSFCHNVQTKVLRIVVLFLFFNTSTIFGEDSSSLEHLSRSRSRQVTYVIEYKNRPEKTAK